MASILWFIWSLRLGEGQSSSSLRLEPNLQLSRRVQIPGLGLRGTDQGFQGPCGESGAAFIILSRSAHIPSMVIGSMVYLKKMPQYAKFLVVV